MHATRTSTKAALSFRVALVMLYGCFIASGLVLLATEGWTKTWKHTKIDTMSPPFADMRSIKGAPESIRQGYNPQRVNPGDPWGRPMNYPKVWIDIGKFFNFGDEDSYLVFNFFFVAAFVTACGWLIWSYPSWTMLLLACSGASILAIERGHNNLVVFPLILLATLSRSSLVSLGFIYVAGILKFFPLAAIVAFWKNRTIAIISTLGALAIIAIALPEIQAIHPITPVGEHFSHGIPSMIKILARQWGLHPSPLLLAAALLLVPLWITLARKPKSKTGPTSIIQTMFLTGSAIYCGSFLLLSSYDYCLIFLLLCIPFLRKIFPALSQLAWGGLIFLAANPFFLDRLPRPTGYYLNIFAKVALFELLGTLLFLMMLDKLYSFLHPHHPTLRATPMPSQRIKAPSSTAEKTR